MPKSRSLERFRRGFVTLYDAWDVLGRLKQERIQWVGADGTRYEDLVTSYQYDFKDGAGTTTITSHLGKTEQTYDALGRLSKTVPPDGASYEVLEYDANDNPVRTKDANGTEVVNTYDVLDRLIRREIKKGKGVEGVDKEYYEYDGLGRRTAMAGDGYVGLTYDSLGRVVSERQAPGFRAPSGKAIARETPRSHEEASIASYLLAKRKERTEHIEPDAARKPGGIQITPAGVKEVMTTYDHSDHLKVVQTYPSKMPRDPAQVPFQIELHNDALERVDSIITRFGQEGLNAKFGYRYIGKERVAIRSYSDFRSDGATGKSTETQYFYDGARRLHGIAHTSPTSRVLPTVPRGTVSLSRAYDQARLTNLKPFAAYIGARDEEDNLIVMQNFLPELGKLEDDKWHFELHTSDYDSLDRVVNSDQIIKSDPETVPEALVKFDLTEALTRWVSGFEPAVTASFQEQKYLPNGARDRTTRTQHDTRLGQDVFTHESTISRTIAPGSLRYDAITIRGKIYHRRYLPILPILADIPGPVGAVFTFASLLLGKGLPVPDGEKSLPSEQYAVRFDNNGNSIEDSNNRYFYDYRNRLVRAVHKLPYNDDRPYAGTYGGTWAEYRYDAMDRLILREERQYAPGTRKGRRNLRTWYIYSGSNCIEEIATEGEGRTLTAVGNTRYIWGARTGELARIDRAPDILSTPDLLRSYYIHEDLDGAPRYFSRFFALLGERVEESSMIQIGGHYFPSIGNHTIMPFPMMGARYDGFFEGHLIDGKPVFNLEQPVNFVERQKRRFRAELARNRYELDSLILSYFQRVLGFVPGPIGLVAENVIELALMSEEDWDDEQFCFLAGTLVETENGRKPIEEIAVGDKVLSKDEHTGEQGLKSVVRLFRNTTEQVVSVSVASGAKESTAQTIHCTPGHPWFVQDKGWTYAAELRVGDRLIGAYGDALEVRVVAVRAEHAETFNVEVEDWSTYFVAGGESEAAIWIHNQSYLRDEQMQGLVDILHRRLFNSRPSRSRRVTGLTEAFRKGRPNYILSWNAGAFSKNMESELRGLLRLFRQRHPSNPFRNVSLVVAPTPTPRIHAEQAGRWYARSHGLAPEGGRQATSSYHCAMCEREQVSNKIKGVTSGSGPKGGIGRPTVSAFPAHMQHERMMRKKVAVRLRKSIKRLRLLRKLRR